MPLSRAEPRKLLHLRDIHLRGYERDDGLVEIEARMTDTKTYSFGNRDRGGIASGEALHDMWLRVTFSKDMVIQACEASMDSTPHQLCPGAAPNFTRLVGLAIGKGFIKSAMQRVGGVEGCTHLRELLQPIATVALQTMMSVNKHDKSAGGGVDPRLVNTCYTYDETGPLITGLKANQSVS